MIATRRAAILEKLANRVGGYKSGLSPDQINERIAKIRAYKGKKRGRTKQGLTDKLYSDVFGSDYKTSLKNDKRFKHAVNPKGTSVGRGVAHSMWGGPIAAVLMGPAGARKKQLQALEKAMKNKAQS